MDPRYPVWMSITDITIHHLGVPGRVGLAALFIGSVWAITISTQCFLRRGRNEVAPRFWIFLPLLFAVALSVAYFGSIFGHMAKYGLFQSWPHLLGLSEQLIKLLTLGTYPAIFSLAFYWFADRRREKDEMAELRAVFEEEA